MRVGFLLRRLALVVEPQPDESFASWVDRMPVVDNRRVTGAQCAGLSGDVRPLAYGVVATTEMCEAIRLFSSAATSGGSSGQAWFGSPQPAQRP